MALNATSMRDQIWNRLLDTTGGEIANARRSNPTRNVPGHNIFREMLTAVSNATVATLAGSVITDLGSGNSGSGASDTLIANVIDVNDVGSNLIDSFVSSHGWIRSYSAGGPVEEMIKEMFRYIRSNMAYDFDPHPSLLSGLGISVVGTIAFSSGALKTATRANLLATGLFHDNDDAARGLTPHTERIFVQTYGDGIAYGVSVTSSSRTWTGGGGSGNPVTGVTHTGVVQ